MQRLIIGALTAFGILLAVPAHASSDVASDRRVAHDTQERPRAVLAQTAHRDAARPHPDSARVGHCTCCAKERLAEPRTGSAPGSIDVR
jgi:hypothetical protein